MTLPVLSPGAGQELTPEEHACAQVTAYHIALTRSDGRSPPPYDHALATGDFLRAAELLVSLREVSGVLDGAAVLHEPDPTEAYRGRPLPIALRRFPLLDDNNVALHEFVEMQDSLADWEYWSLLGHIWVFSQKTPGAFNQLYSQTYGGLFASERPGREQLMTPRERAALAGFANPLTVFRGCQTGLNENGLSWSRSQGVAESFALTYYPFGPRSVLQGECNPADAVAYFDYDNEEEVIIRGELVADKDKIND